MSTNAVASSPKLWLGFFAGPIAWAAQLQLVYALAALACGGSKGILHLGTIICFGVALGGGWIAWWQWRLVGSWSFTGNLDIEGRVRLMAALGLLGSSLFAVVIIAQWLAIVMLDPCSRILR